MEKKRRKHVYFSKFFGSSSFLSLFLFFTTTETPNRISLISFFLSLSLLYSAAHFYVFCGVSSITDDELVFVKKKVFYATHIRKRERDGRGL